MHTLYYTFIHLQLMDKVYYCTRLLGILIVNYYLNIIFFFNRMKSLEIEKIILTKEHAFSTC